MTCFIYISRKNVYNCLSGILSVNKVVINLFMMKDLKLGVLVNATEGLAELGWYILYTVDDMVTDHLQHINSSEQTNPRAM